MKKKRWIVAERDDASAEKLSRELGLPHLTAAVMAARGIKTKEQAVAFMDDSLDNLFDPYLLLDMQKAVDTIEESIGLGERIAIYGDYDVDGVTVLLDGEEIAYASEYIIQPRAGVKWNC